MHIQPFKNRSIDYSKPVQVYRCLVRTGNVYSVKQGGYVVGHTEEITLQDALFRVNQSGRERCLKRQQRNVHAWVEGLINDKDCLSGKIPVTYNPYKNPFFFEKESGKKVEKSKFFCVDKAGVYIKNVN